MKLFLPEGQVRYAHIYEPHTFTKDGPERYMLVIEADYVQGFSEFDDYFKLTPHIKDKTFVKISATKRIEIETNSYDLLKRHYDMNIARNRPVDTIFKEHDIIAELEIQPLPKNIGGYTGFVLVLKGITLNFRGV